MNGGGKAATRSKAHRSGSVPEKPKSSSHSTVTAFYRVSYEGFYRMSLPASPEAAKVHRHPRAHNRWIGLRMDNLC